MHENECTTILGGISMHVMLTRAQWKSTDTNQKIIKRPKIGIKILKIISQSSPLFALFKKLYGHENLHKGVYSLLSERIYCESVESGQLLSSQPSQFLYASDPNSQSTAAPAESTIKQHTWIYCTTNLDIIKVTYYTTAFKSMKITHIYIVNNLHC